MPDPALNTPSAIRTVGIIGPGLIGGSFGLGLRKAGFAGLIVGVGKLPYIESALSVGAIDQIGNLNYVAAIADLLYLSGTVDQILETLDDLRGIARPECMVTDVGSTKRVIVERAERNLPSGSFVGGHPMAGKEKRGAEHADPDLFRDRPYILTSELQSPVFLEFLYWLERMGARILQIEAEQHDTTVAFSSHLPQLLSTALACTLAEQTALPITSIHGSGLIDMTRLALSPSNLWESILDTNRDQVAIALDAYMKQLSALRENLTISEVADNFQAANAFSYLLRTP